MSFKKSTWRGGAVVLTMALMASGLSIGEAEARYPQIGQRAKVSELKPINLPQEPGPVDLLFRFAPPDSYKGDGSFEVRIHRDVSAFYSGPTRWSIVAFPDRPHEEIISISIMPDTNTYLVLEVVGEGYRGLPSANFIDYGDTLIWGYRRPPRKQPNLTGDVTREELDEAWSVSIEFPDEHDIALVESVVGPLITKPAPNAIFSFVVTLRQLRELKRQNVPPLSTRTPPPGFDAGAGRAYWWVSKVNPFGPAGTPLLKAVPVDSVFVADFCQQRPDRCFLARDKERVNRAPYLAPETGPTPEGASPLNMIPSGISLSRVYGMVHPDSVAAIDSVAFEFRINNTTGNYLLGCNHGFEIYSPDGATWGNLQGTWSEASGSWFDYYFDNYFSDDGFGADTVGFAGFVVAWNWGVPPGDTSSIFSISLDLSDPGNVGETICIDTCYYPPGGEWVWSVAPFSTEMVPDWDGPHCFQIGCADLEIAGDVVYRNYEYPGPYYPSIPTGGVLIALHELDLGGDTSAISVTWTDNYGEFTFPLLYNVDFHSSDRRDLYMKVLATSGAASVYDSAALAIWYSDTLYNVDCGTLNWSCDIYEEDKAKYFFVMDIIGEARSYVLANLGLGMPSFDSLRVVVMDLDHGSNAAAPPLTDVWTIGIQDSVDIELAWPDRWDRSVILHEYSEVLLDYHNMSFFGDTMEHRWNDVTNPQMAFNEGVSHLFSAVLQETDSLLNRGGYSPLDVAWHCLETGTWGAHGPNVDDTVFGTANALGPKCEGTVACALWDIFDYQSSMEEFSETTHWNDSTPTTPAYDGIGDEVTMPFTDIFDLLMTDYAATGDYPKTISEFREVWVQENYPYQNEMHNLMFEHAIEFGCCRGIRGNVDGDPAELINVADMSYLIDYLFGDVPPPPCILEADVNTFAGVNISDVTYLTGYLFEGGAAPVDCAGLKRKMTGPVIHSGETQTATGVSHK